MPKMSRVVRFVAGPCLGSVVNGLTCPDRLDDHDLVSNSCTVLWRIVECFPRSRVTSQQLVVDHQHPYMTPS